LAFDLRPVALSMIGLQTWLVERGLVRANGEPNRLELLVS
jgi:hypothetical protein